MKPLIERIQDRLSDILDEVEKEWQGNSRLPLPSWAALEAVNKMVKIIAEEKAQEPEPTPETRQPHPSIITALQWVLHEIKEDQAAHPDEPMQLGDCDHEWQEGSVVDIFFCPKCGISFLAPLREGYTFNIHSMKYEPEDTP